MTFGQPQQFPQQLNLNAVPARPVRGARPGFGKGLAYGIGIPLVVAAFTGVMTFAARDLAPVMALLWLASFAGTLVAAVWQMLARRHFSAVGTGMLLGLVIGMVGQLVATVLLAGARTPGQ